MQQGQINEVRRCRFNRELNFRGLLILSSLILMLTTGCGIHTQSLSADKRDKTEGLSATNTAQSMQKNLAISKVRMQTKNKLEALSAVSYDGSTLNAGVLSFGCTKSTDFIVEHEIVDGRCLVTVVRTKPDLCRRAPMVADLSIAWSVPPDCSELELVIANPILVTNAKGGLTKRFK